MEIEERLTVIRKEGILRKLLIHLLAGKKELLAGERTFVHLFEPVLSGFLNNDPKTENHAIDALEKDGQLEMEIKIWKSISLADKKLLQTPLPYRPNPIPIFNELQFAKTEVDVIQKDCIERTSHFRYRRARAQERVRHLKGNIFSALSGMLPLAIFVCV